MTQMSLWVLEFSVINQHRRRLDGRKNIQQTAFNFWIFCIKYTTFENLAHTIVDHKISVTEEIEFLRVL